MGDRPRVELFARETAPGWDVVGHDVGVSFEDARPRGLSDAGSPMPSAPTTTEGADK